MVLKIPQQARERVNPQPQSEGVGRAQPRTSLYRGAVLPADLSLPNVTGMGC